VLAVVAVPAAKCTTADGKSVMAQFDEASGVAAEPVRMRHENRLEI